MMQSRTYNCNELRSQNIGEKVTLAPDEAVAYLMGKFKEKHII